MCLRFCSVLSILAVIFIQTSLAKPDDSADVQNLSGSRRFGTMLMSELTPMRWSNCARTIWW